MTLANSIPFQCVKNCPLDFTLDGNLIQILTNSELEQTDREHLRTWLRQSQLSKCKIESYYTTGKQKKVDCFSVDGFCAHFNTVFEDIGCYFQFGPCQEAKVSLSEEEAHRGIRKREHDELRRDYLQSKGYKIVEIWDCKMWESVKEEKNIRNHVRKNFPFKLLKKQESLLAKIRDGELFGTYNVI